MAKQNNSASSNTKAQFQLKATEKATLTIPASQHLEQATKSVDGVITIKQSMGALKLVDVADVDLLLTFANGEHIVIPHGAIDALGKNPPIAVFSDSKIGLPELFKLVGVTNPAKAGSLRLVSENIDANPPTDENVSRTDYVPETPPPPAPMLKVGAGQGAGKSLGTGLGSVPETYTPLVTSQPAVYRVGKSQTSTNTGESFGSPKVTSELFTSSELKVTYDGMPQGTPSGAFSAIANATQLTVSASPANQSFVETIAGTTSNDTIDHASNFSTAATQWSKTLHIGIDNFTSVSSITIDFTSNGVPNNALVVPGFSLIGLDGAVVTQDPLNQKIWHVTPTSAMLKEGVNIGIVYDALNITESTLNTSKILNFSGDITVDGKVGAFNFQVINNLYMTWRDAITQADFNIVNENGTQVMVLPQRGVGVIIYGDDPSYPTVGGDDTINAGSGNDIIFGGLGADTMNGGYGSDTVTYENAGESIVATLTNGLVDADNQPVVNNGDQAIGDTFVSGTIENLVGSIYNDILSGDINKNILSGGDGNDTLIGIMGADTFIGGNNTAIDNTYNTSTNLQGDTVSYQYAFAGVSASLSPGGVLTYDALNDVYIDIENLTGSKFADTLEGDRYANVINGGSNNPGITDYVSYEHSSLGVSVDLSNTGQQISTGDANGDILINIQNIKGSAHNDTFTGNLSGNAFNGLGGINTVTYANSASGVTASLKNPSINLGDSALGDTYSNIQNLIGTASADILYGDTNANEIHGGDGNDQIFDGIEGGTKIDAGAGDDKITIQTAINTALDTTINNITGGGGNDTLVLDLKAGGAGDVNGIRSIFVDLKDGQLRNADNSSQVYASLTSIENFDGLISGWGSYNYFVIASGENNRIIGSSYDPARGSVDYRHATNDAVITLSGNTIGAATAIVSASTSTYRSTGTASDGSSTDTLINIGNANGGNFNDKITGTDANNTLNGVNGDDTLYGLGGNDYLVGGNGDDIMDGGNGDDVMDGGNGADAFNGGAGTDTVTYANSGPVIVDINATTSVVNPSRTDHANGDTFNFVEKFIGSSSHDTFILNVGSGFTLPIDINGSSGTDTIKLADLSSGLDTTSFNLIAGKSTSNEVLNIKEGIGSSVNPGISTALKLSAADIISFVDTVKPTLTIYHDSGDALVLDGSTFTNSAGTIALGTNLLGSATSGTYNVVNGGSVIAYINWQA